MLLYGARGRGETGRHAGLRSQSARVEVRFLSTAPKGERMKIMRSMSTFALIVLCGVFLAGCFSTGAPITEAQFRAGFAEANGYTITDNSAIALPAGTTLLKATKTNVTVYFYLYEEGTSHASGRYDYEYNKIKNGIWSMTAETSAPGYNSYKGTKSGTYYVLVHSQNMYLEIVANSSLKKEINDIIKVWDY